MKRKNNVIFGLFIFISVFFINTISTLAYTSKECESKGYGKFTYYYTYQKVNSGTDVVVDNKAGNEIMKITFTPSESYSNRPYSWGTKASTENKGLFKTYKSNLKGAKMFNLVLSQPQLKERQGVITFNNGITCYTEKYQSYESIYEITSMKLNPDNTKIIVEGFAFVISKNNQKVHTVKPKFKLYVKNNEDVYLKENYVKNKKPEDQVYYKNVCKYISSKKAYKCPPDSFAFRTEDKNLATYFNQETATKVNVSNDYSWTRYYADSWGNWRLSNGTVPLGSIEYMYLFNLNKDNFRVSYDMGKNLQRKNSKGEFVAATAKNVVDYFSYREINTKTTPSTYGPPKYGFYINVNFKFEIQIDSLFAALDNSLTPYTSFKLGLLIEDDDSSKDYLQKVYGTNVRMDYIYTYLSQIGIMNKNIPNSDVGSNQAITFDIQNDNEIIKFSSVSTMRGRIFTNINTMPTIFKQGNSIPEWFANSYTDINDKRTYFHNNAGAVKFYYYIEDITINDKYYPVNLYGLKIRTESSTDTRVRLAQCYTTPDKKTTELSNSCYYFAGSSDPYKKIYAHSTWVLPSNITSFKIGCKDGYTLVGNKCCANNMFINLYNTNTKICCDSDEIAKNFSTDSNECCTSGIRTVSTPSGDIKLCENKCTNVICPSGSQKDIDGKCCTTGRISSANGECTVGNEVEATDSNSMICKVSDMTQGAVCNCNPLNITYPCKDNENSVETTPSVKYRVSLSGTPNKTVCTEKYVVEFNKKTKVVQGGFFEYPVRLKVIRECTTGGVQIPNLPSYNTDASIIKEIMANISLNDLTINAEQTSPSLLEHARANDNKKDYSLILKTETKTKSGDTVTQITDYDFVKYQYDYYLNTFTGKIRAAVTGPGDGYYPSGKYVYMLLNVPVRNDYNNDVKIKMHNNSITIDCGYEVQENQKLAFRQFDESKVFARSKLGKNWETETAQNIIDKIQNNSNKVFEEGRAMYEITLDGDAIKKINQYVRLQLHGDYFNPEIRPDGKSVFIYDKFSEYIKPYKDDNLLKDVIVDE